MLIQKMLMLLNKTVLVECQPRIKKAFSHASLHTKGRTKHISIDMSTEIIMGMGKETK